jgi:epoxyqueuosine reductase QueG
MAYQITTMWNDRHLMMATNPQSNYFGIGLSGMIRRPHVRELLKKMGNQLREAQILGIGPESYSSEVSPVATAQYASKNSEEQATSRKRLRKEDLSTLSHRDAKPWLLKIRVGAGNTKEKRIKALEARFKKNPHITELTL